MRSAARQNMARVTYLFWLLVQTTVLTYWVGLKVVDIADKETLVIVNAAIDMAVNALQVVGIHSAMLVADFKHGERLSDAFQRLDQHFRNDGRFFNKIRRLCIWTVVLFLILVKFFLF